MGPFCLSVERGVGPEQGLGGQFKEQGLGAFIFFRREGRRHF